jgi:hypothetical protein
MARREFTAVTADALPLGMKFKARYPASAAKKATTRLAPEDGRPVDVYIYDVEKKTVLHYAGRRIPIRRENAFTRATGIRFEPVVQFVGELGHPFILQQRRVSREIIGRSATRMVREEEEEEEEEEEGG